MISCNMLVGEMYNQLTDKEINVDKDCKLVCGMVVIIINKNIYHLAQFCNIKPDLYKFICLSSGNRTDDSFEFSTFPTIRQVELNCNYTIIPIDVTLILSKLYNKNNIGGDTSIFELTSELEIVL